MDKKQQIREGLKKLAAAVGPLQTILATVVSVDEDEFTCVLNDGEIDLFDVRLRPVLNGNESVTQVPKEGTMVLAARIEDDEDWMVMACDEIEKYKVVVGTTTFEIKDGCLIKRGDETLKLIIDDLIAQIKLIIVPTNVGPSGNPLNGAEFDAIKARADNLLR